MLRSLHGLTPSLRSKPIVVGYGPRIATAAYGNHPNRGNFANRSREEMSAIGYRGGKKGGKARGTGGFHDMDPKKQREIASKGGRATRQAAAIEEAVEESKTGPTMFGGPSEEPSVVPPGFPEWKTTA
ncbi:hypothetical protein PENDEC_c019G06800 [Penicillium decumbens]|uniref:Conidiation-specific protein 10 n=1 Tax=Penicillium decumbens TaxID=69771 RepID=A0A1V6P7P6_PENDC|nr:hypothetical protein PENDEC_c019G06800 [Penicillium decumbens]